MDHLDIDATTYATLSSISEVCSALQGKCAECPFCDFESQGRDGLAGCPLLGAPSDWKVERMDLFGLRGDKI